MLERFEKKNRRRNRIRSVVSGTAVRPRLAVFASNLHISAQLIDDTVGRTIVSAYDTEVKTKGTKTEKAAAVGELIAQKALEVKISNVVFDRGGKLYHGRVKALAEAARTKGLKF
jgi:large subunit ribosomal protein L18